MTPMHNNHNAKTVSPVAFYLLPTLLGMVGGLFSGLLSGFSLISVGMALILGIFGALIGMNLYSRLETKLNETEIMWRGDERYKMDDILGYCKELEQLFLQITPILLRQVVTSKNHTEQEITVLTNKFATIIGGNNEDFFACDRVGLCLNLVAQNESQHKQASFNGRW